MKNQDLYYIDFAARIKKIQGEMAKAGLDVYLGSRLRTLSWTLDAFCPWRSYIVIPREGMPTAFTFVIDAARVADDTWLDEDNVRGYAPMGGQDQITQIADYIIEDLLAGKGRIGYETGLSNYLPEGNLTQYEYEAFKAALPEATFINAHYIVDQLSLIKDEGTINRFREASRQVDVGHKAVYEALIDGGFKKLTETEVAGIAALAMRQEGSEWEWSFTGGNEIASGYRTGYTGGACTPPGRRKLKAGEPLMVDLHAMFMLGLGDHSVNYLLSPVSDRQWWHANNFVGIVRKTLDTYRAGISPSELAAEMLSYADDNGFADYMVPGFEHGIGMMGDEWRIGKHDGPMPYWTDPFHVYQENEMLICAMQYACAEDEIGFRYEAPIVIKEKGIELLPKHPLEIIEIK
jgi:Xaa-Pro aminopeptidase